MPVRTPFLQTIDKKIQDADVRRRSVSTLAVPNKFFGDVGDGAKRDIVAELNGKTTKGPKNYFEGLTVDDKNKEALAILAGKLKRQESIQRKLASTEKQHVTKKKFNTIESLIENNLCCGYLLKFCNREFTAENLLFILGVDEYRDFYSSDGPTVWANDWKDTDVTVKLDELVSAPAPAEGAGADGAAAEAPAASAADSETYWPSSTDKAAAAEAAEALYQKFLSHDSMIQVRACVRVCASGGLPAPPLATLLHPHLVLFVLSVRSLSAPDQHRPEDDGQNRAADEAAAPLRTARLRGGGK